MTTEPIRSHAVGVDVGGTKTRIVWAPLAGDAGAEPAGDVTVATATWRGPLGDAEADAAGIAGLLREHIGTDLSASAVAIGAHGCENTAQCHALEAALRRHLAGPVRVVNDSELIAPAMGAAHAIGVVVGTGSIATARDERGGLATAGGWGWVLGDEGSAPALVRDAARAVLSALDDGDALDPLGRRLFAAYGVTDGDALALALTQATVPDDWGRHAPDVFAAADEGSALADRVIGDAGAQLAVAVDRLLRRGIRADAVVAGGSVIENQPRLQLALRDALARVRPELTFAVLDRPPVLGALALARALAGHDDDHPTQNGASRT